MPTPPIIPPATREPSQSGDTPEASPPSQPKPSLIQSMKGRDRVKASWKSPKRITANMGMPSQRLRTALSILSESLGLSIAGFLSTSFISPLMKPYLASAITVSASSPYTLLKWARLLSLALRTSPLSNTYSVNFLIISSSSSSSFTASHRGEYP